MDDIVVLKQQMTRLKLTGLLESYEERLRQAISGKWKYGDFLSVLFSDEIDRRNNKQLSRRLTLSHLDSDKTLEFFDFNYEFLKAVLDHKAEVLAFPQNWTPFNFRENLI